MYIGYDSTTPDEIPRDAQLVLPYVTGAYKWSDEARKLFPHAIEQTIATYSTIAASFLDVEKGDATALQFPEWHRLSVESGFWRPGYYCSKDTIPQIREAISRAGLAREDYRVWIADPTGTPHIEPGWDACQCIWNALGRNIDESVFLHTAVPPLEIRKTRVDVAQVTFEVQDGHWTIKPLPAIEIS